jgi:hypothetical protein
LLGFGFDDQHCYPSLSVVPELNAAFNISGEPYFGGSHLT